MALKNIIHLLTKLSKAQPSQTWSWNLKFRYRTDPDVDRDGFISGSPSQLFARYYSHSLSSFRIDLCPRGGFWIICAGRSVHLRYIRN
jgi:hypothetical protein